MKKLVVFASGSGSNFQAIIDAIRENQIKAKITGLITNRENTGAEERAKSHQIPVAIISEKEESGFCDKLEQQLSFWSPDLIVLAGFLKKVPDRVVRNYQNRIINIHPSLLPKYGGKGFYGLKVHEAVLQSGDSKTGCTVHYVNEHYDEGDIIEQVEVDVHDTDTPETLAARVLKAEHKLLPNIIQKLLNQP